MKVRGSVGMLGKDNTKAWLWRQNYSYQANKGAVFGTNEQNPVGMGLKMGAALMLMFIGIKVINSISVLILDF